MTKRWRASRVWGVVAVLALTTSSSFAPLASVTAHAQQQDLTGMTVMIEEVPLIPGVPNPNPNPQTLIFNVPEQAPAPNVPAVPNQPAPAPAPAPDVIQQQPNQEAPPQPTPSSEAHPESESSTASSESASESASAEPGALEKVDTRPEMPLYPITRTHLSLLLIQDRTPLTAISTQ